MVRQALAVAAAAVGVGIGVVRGCGESRGGNSGRRRKGERKGGGITI